MHRFFFSLSESRLGGVPGRRHLDGVNTESGAPEWIDEAVCHLLNHAAGWMDAGAAAEPVAAGGMAEVDGTSAHGVRPATREYCFFFLAFGPREFVHGWLADLYPLARHPQLVCHP